MLRPYRWVVAIGKFPTENYIMIIFSVILRSCFPLSLLQIGVGEALGRSTYYFQIFTVSYL